jgi:hypothetical protein
MMKKSLLFFGKLTLILLMLSSCSTDRKGDYLTPLKAEIPEALKENAEAIAFINESTSALNEWSIKFEDLVVECEPFIGKEESELSTMDKLKLGKIMMEFVASMGQFAVNMAEMDQNATTVEYYLDDAGQEALHVVVTIFENRINELNTKYQDFGKEDVE